MMKLNTRLALKAGAAPLVLGVALLSTPALAQAEEGASDEVIIVTGSRIARPDLEASVPVAVVSSQSIQDSGASNIQDVLADLPAVGQNISRTSSNFSTTGNGQATVNLRNLGSARTLVLVNGRRFVAGIPGTSIVDLNTIPTDLIKRVEVVTGGASAVYGSEAIAGVVNFILDDEFQGISARAQGTLSDKGDAGRKYASIVGGTSFGDGRGHIVLSGQYDKDDGLRSRKRSFSFRDLPNRSSFAAQGLFSPSGAFATGAGTFTYDANNVIKNYQGANIDGYNRNDDRYLSVPVERYLASGMAKYDLSDSVTAFAEFEYAKTKSRSSLEPQAVANTDLGTDGIPLTNPLIPAQIMAAITALNTDADPANDVTALPFRRRSNDIFDRSNVNDRDTWRVVAGLRGSLGENLKWDAYYTHGETKDYTASETILGPNYANALDAVLLGGQLVCRDAAARAAGCVPINIFGRNTVSPAAANYVTNNGQLSTYDARVKQDVFSASLSGSVFELPAGPLGFAAGFEYRKESSSEDFDQATNDGLTLGNMLSDTRGSYNVKEGFVELNVPILADRPFFEYLGVEAAARYADYSTIGGVWSWKAGLTWAPVSDIRFRGVYSEATRAPNISELFSAQNETFPAVVDPCDQREGAGDGAPITLARSALPAACLAIPAINAASNTAAGFVYSTAQIQTINGFTGGNLNLTQEKARTLTLGAVFTPSFARNLSLTVDYYRIKVDGAIGIIGQQTSLDECITGGGQAIFCGNIIRDATGRVATVNALNLNTGSYLVSGLDTQLAYRTELGANTKLDLTIAWNHLFRQEQTSFVGGPTQPEVGQLDCYSCGRLGTGFRDKVSTSATVTFGNLSLNWRSRFLSSVVDTLGAAAISTGNYWYNDLQLRLGVGEEKKFEFYLGVDNIGDKLPPVFGDTNPVTFPGTQTSANTYDLYGRMLYAGVQVKF